MDLAHYQQPNFMSGLKKRGENTMAEMVEVAQATITIIPTMKGAQASITEEMTGASTEAGDSAGKAAGTSLSSAMSKSLGESKTLTKGLTVPLVGAATAAVASWKSVDDAMDTVTTKTGATGDALKSMQDIAKGISTSLPVSLQQSGDAVGEVNTRFGVTGDELQGLSTDFLKFAKINNTDVSTSVDSVSKVVAAFGLNASDTSGILDALNTVGQKTGVSVDTLSSEMSTNAAYFNEMGMSAADSANFLGQVDMAGMDSTQMLMGFKTAMKKAAADGVSLNDKLSEFTQTMQGSGTESEKLSAAYDLFGSKAGAAIYNASKNGKLNLENLTGSLSDFTGSVSQTFEDTEDPIDKFTEVLNQVKVTGADTVDSAAPLITGVLSGAGNIIKNISNGWNSLNPAMQTSIIQIAGVAAAVGPVMAVVTKVTGVVGGVISAVRTWGSVQGALNAVLAANPIGAVVIGIAAAIAAIILLWNNCAWFRDGVTTAFNTIKSVAGPIWEGIKTVIGNVWTKAQEIWSACEPFFTALFQGIQAITSTVFGAIGSFITSAWNDVIQPAWTACQPFFEGLFNAINTTVGVVFAIIGAVVVGAWNTIQAVWKFVEPFFSALFNGIAAVAGPIWDGVSGFVTGAWDVIKGVWDTVSGFFEGIWDAVSAPVEGIWNGIKDTFSGAIDWIKGLFNFDWHWPSIPLPHFSLNPSDWQITDIFSGSWPSIGIDWYARAAKSGAVFNSPQVIGVGDAAEGEMLIGEDTLFGMIKDAVKNGNGFTQNNNYYSPKALDPSESARLTKNATRNMVLSLKGAK
jgi:phage-related minor tail protein